MSHLLGGKAVGRPLICIKYWSRSPGQGVCCVRMPVRNTMQGLKTLATIADEISVDAEFVTVTGV